MIRRASHRDTFHLHHSMLMQPLPPAQIRIVGEVISSNPRRIISNIERGWAERAELDPCSAAVVWLRTASGGKFCLFVCLFVAAR